MEEKLGKSSEDLTERLNVQLRFPTYLQLINGLFKFLITVKLTTDGVGSLIIEY